MIGISMRGGDEAEAAFARMNALIEAATAGAVKASSLLVHEGLHDRMSDPGGWHPFWGRKGGTGNTLAVRSGKSRDSLTPGGQVVKVADRMFASVGSPDKHVAFLEEGGEIQGSLYLRIPTAAAQTPMGVDRNAGVSLRNIPGLFLFESRAGNLWAAVKRGRYVRAGNDTPGYQPLTLLYMLKASITYRGRHIFAEILATLRRRINALFQGAIGLSVERGANG